MVNGVQRNRVARLHPDATIDESFDPGAGSNGIVYAIAVDRDGRVLVGGDFDEFNGVERNGLARLGTDGGLDESFQPGIGADGPVRALLVRERDVLVAGEFEDYGGLGFMGLVSVATVPWLRVGTLGLDDDIIRLTVTGPEGQRFRMLRSSNLVDWEEWKTSVIGKADCGLIDNTATASQRFYRAVVDE